MLKNTKCKSDLIQIIKRLRENKYLHYLEESKVSQLSAQTL